jgi:hypothetical protein
MVIAFCYFVDSVLFASIIFELIKGEMAYVKNLENMQHVRFDS